MSTELPLYEGDGLIRRGGLLAMDERVPTAAEQFRRSPFAVIGDVLRGLFRRLEAIEHRMRYRELERYLADSSDVFELERRMRDIERRHGAGSGSYF